MIQIPDHEIWLPRSIRFAMGQPIVTVVCLPTLPLGFISDLDLVGETRSLPLCDLQLPADSRPNGLIFHLPRSGSTAVARVVSTLPDSACIFEPAGLNELLTPILTGNAIEPVWLKQLLGLYAHGYRRANSSIYIKLSSWQLACADWYTQAAATTPQAVIYREPLEVLVQILQRPTGWMTPSVRPHLRRLLNIEQSNQDSAQYCSAVLAQFCQRALHLCAPAIAAHHSLSNDLNDRVLPALATHTTAQERQTALRALVNDSENWEDEHRYQPDSTALQASASDQLKRLAKYQVQPHIERLEQQFGP